MANEGHEKGIKRMRTSNGHGERESTSTSRSLIQRVRVKDPEAWHRLIVLYSPLVWHWCRKMELPAQDAADIFQDVFQAVALHLQQFRLEQPGDTFRGWLRTITKNKVHDHYRNRRHEPQAAGGSEAQAWWTRIPDVTNRIDTGDQSDEENELFRRALDIIKSDFEESTWQAFWRVAVDGRTPQDVAHELGMSQGAVRVAKCRVLHRLRQELGDLQG